jgi:glycerol-3-phosphate O-acyltransferase
MFEIRNLATEMVSGDVPELAFFKLISMIGKEKGKLGRIFCNFGNPINVKDYLSNINIKVLNADNIDDTALRLTEKLYKEQHFATSINLNMIAATLLLQESRKRVSLSTILSNSKKIYSYLKGRKVNMVMTIEPQIFALTKVIQKLGF